MESLCKEAAMRVVRRIIPEIKNDDRIWVVGLEVVLDTYLVDIVDQKAAAAAQRMGRHPETRNDKIE